MDDLSRRWIHGQAGLDEINAAMAGDMRDAWIAEAVQQTTEDPPRPPMWQRNRPATGSGRPRRFRLTLLALAVAMIAVFILANL
jgi:hypothetical protein